MAHCTAVNKVQKCQSSLRWYKQQAICFLFSLMNQCTIFQTQQNKAKKFTWILFQSWQATQDKLQSWRFEIIQLHDKKLQLRWGAILDHWIGGKILNYWISGQIYILNYWTGGQICIFLYLHNLPLVACPPVETTMCWVGTIVNKTMVKS